MSAFVVEDKTINRVLGYLNNQQRDLCGYFRDVLEAAEISTGEDWQERLGLTMLQMNQDAVNQRYSESTVLTAFDFHWELANDYQTLKSLQCYLYQCSEGDVPERPLYKALRGVEHFLMGRIIGNLPQYDKAEWA